jgi:hypothetical protein
MIPEPVDDQDLILGIFQFVSSPIASSVTMAAMKWKDHHLLRDGH